MPLRRTERSDGRQRPRWKDGSHDPVESTHANESRCDEIALTPNPRTEPLVTVPPLLRRNHEQEVSTRDRPARTGADARIEASGANREVRLALLPYGREGVSMRFPCTLLEFHSQFPDAAHCWAALRRARWPQGFRCPRCSSEGSHFIASRRLEQCRSCRYQSSATGARLWPCCRGRTRSSTT
jgi:hypothetical protein